MDAELKKQFDGLNSQLSGIKADINDNKESLLKITRSNTDIQNDILHIRGHIITKFAEENRDLRCRVRTLEHRLLQLEKTTNRIEQNHRKNNIEFDGIPNSVTDDNLVDTVVNIVKDITKEEITKADIEACHRLKSKRSPKPTIIRANRILLDKIRKNRKSLIGIGGRLNFPEGSKIFVNENLSSNMRTLDYNARLLVKNNQATSAWFSNAAVKVKTLDGNVLTFQHEMDLYEQFPKFEGFSFDTSLYENVLDTDMEQYDDLAGLEIESVTKLDT